MVDLPAAGDPAELPQPYPLPASHAQQRLWLVSQLAADLAVYNIGCPFPVGRAGEPVDLASLRKAFATIVARHESLRTCLAIRDGELTQLVHPRVPVRIGHVDLRHLPAAQRAAEKVRLSVRDAATPFALDRAPLWRASILRLTDDTCELLFVVHHAVFDGRSVDNFATELYGGYRARRAGRTPNLPELPIQYGDFAAWQRDRLASGELDEQLDHWRRTLTPLPPALRLPALAGRELGGSPHRGGDVQFAGDRRLADRVRALAQAYRTTPYVVLLTAFAALLSRLTGETDLVIGTPVDGRDRPELAALIGMFVNTLPLRVDCSGQPGFGELLGRVRGTVLDALDHQEVPYDRLVQTLTPQGEASGSGLHQVVFNLLPAIPNHQIRNGTAKVDLAVDLTETAAGYDGRLEYRSDLLDEPAAAAFAARFLRLLAAGVAAPGTPVGRLPLLDQAERERILRLSAAPRASVRSAGPSGDVPAWPAPTAVVTEVFAARAAAHAEATAVVDGTGCRLTYRELDRRSNQLARHLAATVPVRPDTPVGLLLDNDADLPVAVLAVLKAGGAYLPLDPRYPSERLAYQLDDAGAAAVITASAALVPPAAAEAVARHGCPLIDLRAAAGVIAGRDAGPLPAHPHPDSLAYVIYTSGSTGRPKGVGVAHRHLAGYAGQVLDLLDAAAGNAFCLLQPPTFDSSATMFYGALLSGGVLHLVPRDVATDPQRMVEHLARDRIDYLKITPAHLLALQSGRTEAGELLPRRMLIVGGEASRWDWFRSLRRTGRAAGCAVVNHYGPTETTVGVHVLRGDIEPDGSPATTPLGRALPYATGYVLDGWLEPVPDGVPGELYLGGATVSRGYLGRPGLTAERFIPDQFGGGPGTRLYRTGDRVRRLPGGELEFLGRVDDQVKIRGYRVELGEVRHVLMASPMVADCAVVLRGDRLVGYVVPSAGADLDPDELRRFAAPRLPEYMLPAAFVSMAALPLSAHGKVDAARLPDPAGAAAARPAAGTVPDAPRTATEDLVAAAFAQLLGRDRVGRDDGFFALGGHSLLAIQLISRLRAAFGVAAPVQAIFADPTVAGIAAAVDAQLHSHGQQLPAVRRTDRDRPLPASYGQRRLWFLDQLDGGAVYNTNLRLELSGPLDADLLRRALVGIVARHEVLRTRLVGVDGELWQDIREEPELPWSMVDLSGTAGPRAQRLARAEQLMGELAGRHFDLATEPPLRALLLRIAGEEHLLLLTLHHVANDARSAVLLTRELAERYEALRADRPVALPELPVQYADYAAWQHRLVTDELKETELAYWRSRLAGMPERLALPTDRPRPSRPRYTGAHVPVHVPAPVVERLRAIGADENASLFMVALAGFVAVLERYSGLRDLVVGTPVANRPLPELEPLIGFFLNTLVLRTDCSGDPSFRELVRRVRQTVLDAFANQDIPFEALVDQLRPSRDLGGTPLVQALFTLEDDERRPVSAGGVRMRWQPFGTPTAKFDVSLYLWRRPDGLTGVVEYRTDLFDAATMRRFAAHVTTLLAAAAWSPDTPAPDLPMVTPAEVELLDRCNATTTGRETTPLVPDLVAARAVDDPGATALVWRGRRISYGEFATAVDRTAGLLRGRGVRAGDVVGVLLDRGADLVTTVHAIQATGAAYLPLETDHPTERLAFQCADAGVALVVTGSTLAGRLAGIDAAVLVLDDPAPSAGAAGASGGGRGVTRPGPASLAYVIYTSGSTGTPKGAAVSHAAIANRLHWMQRTFPLRAGERVLHKTPVGFDVSVWELFWPLMAGATLVVAEPGGHRDTRYLADLIRDERITTVHFVPSMLDAFLDEPGTAGLGGAGLRRVICSGEALTPELAARCHAALPGVELHNLYGPTEAAVDVTWHRYRPGEPRLPIGAPIANTRIHVLDRRGARAPVGVPGELCIAGVQLAHGYLNRPALTAGRFVPDPFGPPGTRLYRTGDLARWLPDGQVEYLGRLDHQVKIRGMRVEPGEIEAALVAHPAVRAAVVMVSQPAGAATMLAAYLVPADPADPPVPATLRGHLAATLPPHMIPTAYRILDELPRLANGKLDRRALPVIPGPDRAGDDEFIPPGTPAERAVAGVWASVLGVRRVGAGDDFFASGGDSIRALKVVARLRGAGYRVELQQLFIHQTVRELAAALTTAGDGRARPAPPGTPPTRPFALLSTGVASRVLALWPSAEDAYPLSALQAGMLFHNELDESRATYHDVFTVQLAGGGYRPEDLRRAAARVAARHPILRSSMHLAEVDEPVQVVHASVDLPVTEVDARSCPEDQVDELLAAFQDAEKRRPFDPATPPLLRLFAHRLPGDRTAVTLSFQHAILDGWSVAALTTELLSRYAAAGRGGTSGPQPGPDGGGPATEGGPATGPGPADGGGTAAAYRDFVAEELARRDSPESAGFWRALLAGAPDARLPRLPGRGSGAGPVDTERTELDGDLVTGLRRVARSARVPLRTVLLAAHLRVLALLTGDPDVITGIVTHGRPQHESAARVLGMFLNTIPIRVRVDRPSWSALIRTVYDTEVAAIPHRTYPLVDIQRASGRAPVFDVLFDYRDFHVYGELPEDDGMRIVGYRFFEQTDLPFAANVIRGQGGGLTLALRYDSAQFAREQVEAIRERYLLVLRSLAADLAADPRPVAGYLGADRERIDGWNRTDRALPGGTVPAVIAAQALRSPDLPAVVSGQVTLSYAEFAARVNRLARHLVSQGVRPGDVVGVCLPRGVDLLVAVHAIMAAGAAYLPLEPDYPTRRLEFMIADAGASRTLTTADLAGRVPGTRTVCLDTDADAIGRAAPDPLPVPVAQSSLGYVIYTSGSTGRPKGVAVGHRAIANRLRWMQDAYPIGPGDRVLHKTPFSFDVSVWELCWPLMVGASVIVADPGGHRDPGYLADLVAKRAATVVHFVPSMLDAMLEEPGLADRLGTLRLMFCSGEALRPDTAARLHATLPHLALHNLYGPTEAAVDVTAHACRPGEATIPIGRPVANTRIEILDATGERVPVGTPGELNIGGIQLAHCYIGRPGLTAERFAPDPFGPPGGRLYRTGDLARWLPGGRIEYLGRLDHQVKVRGFRVELGEIEAALLADPQVRAAAVLASQGGDGGRRIVGYLVAGPEGELDTRRLTERLRDRLPEYMLPSVYVTLPELPLTHNGKLDRAALPEPDPHGGTPFEPPATAAEQAIASVWAQVLGGGPVGVNDNFFTLGGDSIRSLKIVARLRGTGHQVTVADLYRHPTVRGLARATSAAPEAQPAPPGQREPAATTAFGLVNEQDLLTLARRFGGTPQ